MNLSDAHLQQLIADLPADAKPGEHLLVASVTEHGVRVAAQFTFTHGWTLREAAEVDWQIGDASVSATILKRW